MPIKYLEVHADGVSTCGITGFTCVNLMCMRMMVRVTTLV